MNDKTLKKQFYFLTTALIFLFAVSITAQTTEFTYQGKLTDTGTPSATYDFEFRLCDSPTDCSLPVGTQQIAGVPVSNGVFTVTLNFSDIVFDGSDRWLEIAVKRPAQGTYTTLTPRQPLTSAPYSIRSLDTTRFDGLTTGGFIQNRTTQQTGNFNISGNGIVGGNLGIGTTTPTLGRLQVNSSVGVTTAIYGLNSSNGTAVSGESTTGIGVAGVSGSNGIGVFGLNNNQNGYAGRFDGNVLINGGNLSVSGYLLLSTLGVAGGTLLCRNNANLIAACSSSLRYKKDFQPFDGGLDIINRLRPISYSWKDGGTRDVGFGAEDVEKVNPLFVTYNDKGEVEGVKYDRFSVLFVNAVKEQQAQIAQQQQQIERQQQQIDALTRLICSQNPQTEICREK